MLIYLHIPKTGGTTLHSVLSQRYSRDATFRYVGPDAEGAFRQLSQARQQSIKLMRGHFPFGLHKLIERPSFYVTFLRDPIDRVVSLYYNGIRRPDHKFQRLGLTPDMSLLDFIHSGIAEDRVNNGQTWYLSGGDAVDGASETSG